MHFFRRPFIIAGRVFRAFLEKEKNVFFFMTNENSDPGLVLDTVSQKLSIDDFLNWHNPIELNKNQVRLWIYLSGSILTFLND